MKQAELIVPIYITRPRSRPYPLNLNKLMNTHRQSIGNMIHRYHDLIIEDVLKLPIFHKAQITYTLYPKYDCDVANVLCVVDKFFCDVLVRANRLPDDNKSLLPKVIYQWGEFDKKNPHAHILIEEIL